MFDYWLTVYKRTWKGTMVSSFLLPMLYLAAMGIGLGSFVDSNGTGALGGVSYLQFIAPGLLASTAMQIAVGESTYPVMSGLKWQKFYHSMIATPLRPADVVYGQLAFIAFRVFTSCAVFLVIIALFGGLKSPLGVLGLPVALLVGMAVAGSDRGVRDDPRQRLRVRDGLPVRCGAGVPVLRGVLPGLAAAGLDRVAGVRESAVARGRPVPQPQPRHGRTRCWRSATSPTCWRGSSSAPASPSAASPRG